MRTDTLTFRGGVSLRAVIYFVVSPRFNIQTQKVYLPILVYRRQDSGLLTPPLPLSDGRVLFTPVVSFRRSYLEVCKKRI